MHIELEIHHCAQACIVKCVNAFDDDYIMWFKILARHICAAVMRIIIALSGFSPAIEQFAHIFQQLVVIKDGRLIVIEQAALLETQIGMIFIVSILVDDQNAFVDHGRQLFGQRGFSASACTTDSDKQHMDIRSPFSVATR